MGDTTIGVRRRLGLDGAASSAAMLNVTAVCSQEPNACACCGWDRVVQKSVLWPALVEEWGLVAEEEAYINRQQGTCCAKCGVNLRTMALARGILDWAGAAPPFDRFVGSWRFRWLRMLELNEAGNLHPLLRRSKRHAFGKYPEVDMLALPYGAGDFDLVVHSDTLEHVPDPLKGLRECRRVLRPGGACIFTVPIVVGRMSRSRACLPASYHGNAANRSPDYLVQTEFGADVWTLAFAAGFTSVKIVAQEYPAGLACIFEAGR